MSRSWPKRSQESASLARKRPIRLSSQHGFKPAVLVAHSGTGASWVAARPRQTLNITTGPTAVLLVVASRSHSCAVASLDSCHR